MLYKPFEDERLMCLANSGYAPVMGDHILMYIPEDRGNWWSILEIVQLSLSGGFIGKIIKGDCAHTDRIMFGHIVKCFEKNEFNDLYLIMPVNCASMWTNINE